MLPDMGFLTVFVVFNNINISEYVNQAQGIFQDIIR